MKVTGKMINCTDQGGWIMLMDDIMMGNGEMVNIMGMELMEHIPDSLKMASTMEKEN